MRVVFFGTPEFAIPSLEAIARSRHDLALVIAQPDRPAGRGMKLKKPPVVEKAMDLGLSVRQPETIRADEFMRSVKELRPDIGVVIAYGKILPATLLTVPVHGFVNVHASLLPKYRGAAPIQRAIEDGARRTGVTIMRLDEELDHGPILSARGVGIESDERAPELFDRLSVIGADLLVETLDEIAAGRVTPVEQDHTKATVAPRIEKHEGRVTLAEPARAIYDRFRAFWPWPGLTVNAGGESLKLMELAPIAGQTGQKPGTVLSIDAESIMVATGKGALQLREVQRPGRRSVNAADYARGRHLEPGMSLV